jgi:hypothetical protein
MAQILGFPKASCLPGLPGYIPTAEAREIFENLRAGNFCWSKDKFSYANARYLWNSSKFAGSDLGLATADSCD